MVEIYLPGRDIARVLGSLILDLNGTLTVDGCLIEGVNSRLQELKTVLQIYLVTSDTLGSGSSIADDLGIPIIKVGRAGGGADKLDFLNKIGAEQTAVIGNGYNDRLILENAGFAIAVAGPEGCCTQALIKADLVVTNILDALDLLLKPLRIIATLRD
ncbi:MAG: ATPase P [Syntrophomonadaceae bacterium]|nr:ATPase P [Syntrophomonadaceae bacterium]